MAKGFSLHIGLNSVDPNHYSGWNGSLATAENDANDLFLITKSCGFESSKLLRDEATRANVMSAITNAAKTLTKGDLFVVSFSGNGGQLPDLNSDEDDGLDETWCLFDAELVDDELSHLWSGFAKGVRILVISDTCYSGTIIKVVRSLERPKTEFQPRCMPCEIASTTYFNNKEFYDHILEKVNNIDSHHIQASVKLISGCQDNQFAFEGHFNGQFTGVLKRIWNGGKFTGNYFSFYKQIMNFMPPEQTPHYYNIGEPNQAFDEQNPFSI